MSLRHEDLGRHARRQFTATMIQNLDASHRRCLRGGLHSIKATASRVCAKKLVFWRQAAKVAYRIKAGQDDPGRFIMRKLAYACVAIILLAEPALALPVIPMPVAPVLSGGQIVYAGIASLVARCAVIIVTITEKQQH